MQNIELAPENPFSDPLEESESLEHQLNPGNQWEAITEILAVAVPRNRFRQQQLSD